MNPCLYSVPDWRAVAITARFSCNRMAEALGVSLRTLERFFHAKFRVTPRQWITQLRLRIADELLRTPLRVKEIAARLCCHPAAIAKLYRRHCARSVTAARLALLRKTAHRTARIRPRVAFGKAMSRLAKPRSLSRRARRAKSSA